jgi:hypothetical protein
VTLADTITRALEQNGARNARRLARLVIAEVRDHDQHLAATIRHTSPPYADCPDGCVVGAEWRRQAMAAKEAERGDV